MNNQVLVDADLHLDVDGLDVHLTGSGRRLQLVVDRPAAVYARYRDIAPPAAARTRAVGLARRLHDAGVSLDVVVRGRTLVTVGSGGRSTPARNAARLALIRPGADVARAALAGTVFAIALILAMRSRRIVADHLIH